MDNAIPGKGAVLTELSLFWFELLGDIVENHLISADVDQYPQECQPYADQLKGRSMLVKKTRPLAIECIVRGYISGSFWSAYQKNPMVCGFNLPTGMQESDKFPEPLFTPSTKAELGDHDENISLEQMKQLVGTERAEEIAGICLALYKKAADYALSKGIIIADTKFELGELDGRLILIDEVLTPDSSRFWPVDLYEPGKSQPSFDKQFLRDYLSTLDWDKTPPPPPLPDHVTEKTKMRYEEARQKITGKR
jgi:phosphoribosylaminoimidazole-succinocarboxamide synthase